MAKGSKVKGHEAWRAELTPSPPKRRSLCGMCDATFMCCGNYRKYELQNYKELGKMLIREMKITLDFFKMVGSNEGFMANNKQ